LAKIGLVSAMAETPEDIQFEEEDASNVGPALLEDGYGTDVEDDEGDQTDIEDDDDGDDGQKDLKRAELQQLLDRQFSADDGPVSATDANQARVQLRQLLNRSPGTTTTTTDSTGQPLVNAATAAPVLRDIPSNNKPGGATTQWGIQSYGAVRFEPSKTSQSLRQGLVEQRQIADSMYIDSRFAPVEDYDYAYQPPIPGVAPYYYGRYITVVPRS
jgi:hypothetical protein